MRGTGGEKQREEKSLGFYSEDRKRKVKGTAWKR